MEQYKYKYTVFRGGVLIKKDIDKKEANELKKHYEIQGYDDVVLEVEREVIQ